jgi:hypothetical protein
MENASGILQLFNWVDVVIALGLIGGLLVGFGLGFYRQVAISVSLVLGLIVASQATAPLAATELFEGLHARVGKSGAEAMAYTLILLMTLLAGLSSLLLFRRFFGKTLQMFDALLGGAVGLSAGAFLFGLVALGVFHWSDTPLHKPIRGSFLGAKLAEGARVASRIFPEDYRARVEASLELHLAELAGTAAPGRVPASTGTPEKSAGEER